MYNFRWSWELCLLISNCLLMLIQAIFYLTIDEVVVQEDTQRFNSLSESLTSVCRFLKKSGNWLWLLTLCLTSGAKYLTYLWLPYYFGKIGHEEHAATISFVYLLVTPFANLLFDSVSKRVAISEEYLVCIFLVFPVVILGALALFINPKSPIWLYMLMLILLSLAQGGPRLFLLSTERRKRAPGSLEFFIASVLKNVSVQPLGFISNISLGYLIERVNFVGCFT